MTNLDSQIEELIKERNAFEAENIALKAQVNELRDGVTWFNRSGGDLTKLLTAYIDTPEQCLNSVKVKAYEQGFRYSCAVYNGGSSKQVIEVAVDSYKDELEANNG